MFGYRTLMAKMRLGLQQMQDWVADRYLNAKKVVMDKWEAIKAKFANTQNPMMLKMQAKMNRAHIKALENQIKFTRKMKEAKAKRDLESAQQRIEKLEAIIAGAQDRDLNFLNRGALLDAQNALGYERKVLKIVIDKASKVTDVEIHLRDKANEIDSFMENVGCHEIGYNLGTDKHIRGEC
jgi:hypothetical protein